MQERRNSSELSMKLRLSCINPLDIIVDSFDIHQGTFWIIQYYKSFPELVS